MISVYFKCVCKNVCTNIFLIYNVASHLIYLLFSSIFEVAHPNPEGSSYKKKQFGPIFLMIIATLVVIACCYIYYLIRRKLAEGQGTQCEKNHLLSCQNENNLVSSIQLARD